MQFLIVDITLLHNFSLGDSMLDCYRARGSKKVKLDINIPCRIPIAIAGTIYVHWLRAEKLFCVTFV